MIEEMIKESYISMWKKLLNDAIKVRVARPSVLSASKVLFDDYKKGEINWDEFEIRFRKEILSNQKAMVELKRLKQLSQEKDVYLICYEKEYPCHRFILVDLIKELK
jgi:uncharacterized protein YeaO (DUF488 family)